MADSRVDSALETASRGNSEWQAGKGRDQGALVGPMEMVVDFQVGQSINWTRPSQLVVGCG